MDESKIFIGNLPKPNGEIFPRYIERGVGFFCRRVYHLHGTQLVHTIYKGSDSFDFSEYCQEYRGRLRDSYPQFNP